MVQELGKELSSESTQPEETPPLSSENLGADSTFCTLHVI